MPRIRSLLPGLALCAAVVAVAFAIYAGIDDPRADPAASRVGSGALEVRLPEVKWPDVAADRRARDRVEVLARAEESRARRDARTLRRAARRATGGAPAPVAPESGADRGVDAGGGEQPEAGGKPDSGAHDGRNGEQRPDGDEGAGNDAAEPSPTPVAASPPVDAAPTPAPAPAPRDDADQGGLASRGDADRGRDDGDHGHDGGQDTGGYRDRSHADGQSAGPDAAQGHSDGRGAGGRAEPVVRPRPGVSGAG